MTPEIELWRCGVKVKVFKHIIDEFNSYKFTFTVRHGDNVSPEFMTQLNHFCIAKQQTQLIIDRMKAAA